MMSILTIESRMICGNLESDSTERELARFLREQMVLRTQLRTNGRDPVFCARVHGRLREIDVQIDVTRHNLAESLRERRAARAA